MPIARFFPLLLAALAALGVLVPAAGAVVNVDTVAGNGTAGFAGDDGPAVQAQLNGPTDVAPGEGFFLVADTANHVIRRIDSTTGTITTVAGTPNSAGFSGDTGLATSAQLNGPRGVLTLDSGDFAIADSDNNRVRVVDGATGNISTIAGTGFPGEAGDGGPAAAAELFAPTDLNYGDGGSMYVADTGNERIRRLSDFSGGTISTIAGGNTSLGDDILATTADIDAPTAVASFNPTDGFFFTVATAGRLRRVDTTGFLRASQSGLNGPQGVARTKSDVFISDTGNNQIRSLALSDVVAGDGTAGFAGDGGPALLARFQVPSGLGGVTDGALVADTGNHRVRLVREVGAPPVIPPPQPTPPPLTPPVAPPAAPVLAATAAVNVVSGRVSVRIPGTDRFVALTGATTLRTGSELDATQGSVRIVVALPGGGTQEATAAGGRFRLFQRRSDGFTRFSLSAPLTGCVTARARTRVGGVTARAAKRARKRRLKVRARGRFGTSGRYGSAIVRGTRWSTIDQCAGTASRTTVVVFEGVVEVRDRRTGRATRTRKGRSTVLRAVSVRQVAPRRP